MGKITGNEPAQPVVVEQMTPVRPDQRPHPKPVSMIQVESPGLTIRQEFAARAMQGYISAGNNNSPDMERIAHLAVTQADWLIAELNKPTNGTATHQ